MTEASVGVKIPAIMPPMMMTGASSEGRAATKRTPISRRGTRAPAG